MKDYDILSDDIYKLIRKIAIPASIGSFFTTLYNVIDTIFAGYIDDNGAGLAGISITFPLFLLVLSVAIGLGSGTTALVGNALGEKDEAKAREITYSALFLTLVISIVSLFITYPLLTPILKFMKVSDEVLPHALSYIRIMYLGVLTFTIPGVSNAVMSAQGKTKPYQNILIIGFFLNIIFNPLLLGRNPLYFIEHFTYKVINIISFGGVELVARSNEYIPFLPDLGAAGIALATIIIQLCQTIYITNALRKSSLFQGVSITSEFKVSLEAMGTLIKQSLPAMLNILTITTGIFILNYFVSYAGGTDATAALGIGYRVEQIAMMPASGIYIALMVITAQNKGAGNTERIFEGFYKCLKISFIFMTTGSVIIFLTKGLLINLFTTNQEIISLAKGYLNIEIFALPAYALLLSTVYSFQGLKKPKIPMYVTFYRQFFMPLTLYSLVTFVFKLPLHFIWISVIINIWSASLFLLWRLKKEFRGLKSERV